MLYVSEKLKNRMLIRKVDYNGGEKWAYSYFVGIIINQCKVLEGNLRKNFNIICTIYPIISL